MLAIEVECALEVLDDAIADRPDLAVVMERRPDAVEVRAKASAAIWICAHAGKIGNSSAISPGSHAPDDPEGSAVEVALDAQHGCPALGHALLHIRPLPGQLDRRLDGFRTGVHGEDALVGEHLCDLPGELGKDRVVERARGQGELLSLLDERFDDPGVAVALQTDSSGCLEERNQEKTDLIDSTVVRTREPTRRGASSRKELTSRRTAYRCTPSLLDPIL